MIKIILFNIWQQRETTVYLFIMAAKRIYSQALLEDVENIDIWLREIELWQCGTDISIKQHRPAIYLPLPSKFRQACVDISVQSLSSDNGLSILLEEIKRLYAKDKYLVAKWHMIHLKHSIVQVT